MYPRIAQFKTVTAFRDHLAGLGMELPIDDRILSAAEGSPLAEPLAIGPFTVGNRWCIHPMEGWDGNRDGTPSDLTTRRWRHFGTSGAKLIWGGEAAAVQHDGRANPRQIMATPEHRAALAGLLDALRGAHREACGSDDDLLVGLQLTHSGRFSRPDGPPQPRIVYHHPLLDPRVGIEPDDDRAVWTDDAFERLIDTYVAAARTARQAGFQFVDVKACHGYLLHESLSARIRPGRFGGDFEGRTRLLTTIIGRIRQELPELLVGVRLSVFDPGPYRPADAEGGRHGDGQQRGANVGVAAWRGPGPYLFGFGAHEDDPARIDLREPVRLLERLAELGVATVNITCGSPYYCPHAQRPATFPPSDGYQPPEDPLVNVWRMLDVARLCRDALRRLRAPTSPEMPLVGTGYSYLQDYLPQVAQGLVRAGWIDAVGLGRVVLSYPELPRDTLAGATLARKKVCRTFSDCTTAPRNGLVSGCYPLDPFYKELPEAEALKEIKELRRVK